MFGLRRRHAAAPQPAPAPPLTDEALTGAVRGVLSGFLGVNGRWSLVRRGTQDTDAVFRDLMTRAITDAVVASVWQAQTRSGAAGAEPGRPPSGNAAGSGSADSGADDDLDVWPHLSAGPILPAAAPAPLPPQAARDDAQPAAAAHGRGAQEAGPVDPAG